MGEEVCKNKKNTKKKQVKTTYGQGKRERERERERRLGEKPKEKNIEGRRCSEEPVGSP